MNKQENTNKVKKIIPSKLETGFQQILYKTLGKHIPKNMTPNQVTLIGAIRRIIWNYMCISIKNKYFIFNRYNSWTIMSFNL